MTVVKSLYTINVGGQNITSRIRPLLIDLSVTDNVGTHSDTATIKIDDTGGRVFMPQIGAPVTVAVGSNVAGMGLVFTGVVDEVQAEGSRSGRTVTVSAKGLDTTGKAKEPQQAHFDESTIQDILNQAGSRCGISVECRDGLGGLQRKYLEMRDESFIHLGERIAREVGGNFRITGNRATLTKRNVGFEGFVSAIWGQNLHSYAISPRLGRPQFSETLARWYDKDEAEWKETTKGTGLSDAAARFVNRYIQPDEQETQQRTDADAATAERDKGEGQVVIEINPAARPDGICAVSVGKAGIDGAYRIESVTHKISRGSGGTSTIQLKQPQG